MRISDIQEATNTFLTRMSPVLLSAINVIAILPFQSYIILALSVQAFATTRRTQIMVLEPLARGVTEAFQNTIRDKVRDDRRLSVD